MSRDSSGRRIECCSLPQRRPRCHPEPGRAIFARTAVRDLLSSDRQHDAIPLQRFAGSALRLGGWHVDSHGTMSPYEAVTLPRSKKPLRCTQKQEIAKRTCLSLYITV